jgi:hypothetical protein
MTGGREWMAHASCATASARGLPWTTDTDQLTDPAVEAMRAVCADCPVRPTCRAHADTTGVSGGWWAGHDYDPDARAWGRIEWVPITHRKHIIGYQAALPLNLLTGGEAA